MAIYPIAYVGQLFTADFWNAGQIDNTVKSTVESITSDSTLTNDSELSSIALGVGTFWIRTLLLVTCASATPDFKTAWAFTGTWSNPIRSLKGPGTAQTALSNAVTDVTLRGVAATTSYTYGLPASGAYMVIEEETFEAVVTVAGNFSVQWAQATSDATATAVQAGSTVSFKQIAE